jgi:hypothetical protein
VKNLPVKIGNNVKVIRGADTRVRWSAEDWEKRVHKKDKKTRKWP